MSVVLVLKEQHILVLNGGDLATRVGPDLSAAHVNSDDCKVKVILIFLS